MDAKLAPAQLVGQVLESKYRIEQHIGSGAMGSVFRARHLRLPRAYAIKLLHPRFLSDAKLQKRFVREAELAARLCHPNVIGVLDIGEVDGASFLVMDLAVGATLAELLVEAPFDPLRVCRIVRQLCDGLAHAHGHGLIHRDLKPDNVIVENHGGDEVARIADFGIAILREPTESSERITTGGVVLGTPHYMAPEMAAGRPYDHRVDLYALGVLCYEMLTGRWPFEGNGVDIVYSHVHDDPPAMAQRVPGLVVDPALEAFARTLLAKHPDDRPADAAIARDHIELVAHSLLARPTMPVLPLRRTGPRPVVQPRDVPPPDAEAMGSAKTMAISTLEQLAIDDSSDRH